MSINGTLAAAPLLERRARRRRASDEDGAVRDRALIKRHHLHVERVVARQTAERDAVANELNEERTRCKLATTELNRLTALLATAEDHIRRLQRLLPVCGCCKKLRDDARYRQQVARYFQAEQQEATAGLGVCPECAPDTDRRMSRSCQTAGAHSPAARVQPLRHVAEQKTNGTRAPH